MLFDPLLRRWDRFASTRSRMRYLPPRLLKHITDHQSVLDIGAGDGRIAQSLMRERPGLSITGVDLGVRAGAAIPVLAYDGQRLPFADHSFDLVLLIDVLHHTETPEQVLAEACRVARRAILIKDHYWERPWDRWLLALADYLGNKAYDVPLPYAFLRMDEWDRLFRMTGLRVISMERFRFSAIDRCKQVVFLVAPPGGSHAARGACSMW